MNFYPRLLDLYCGAGGAMMGYHMAGFEVLGVDSEPQPHYPGPFLQYDVLKLPVGLLRMFDAIHASPPCQKHTALKSAPGARRHVDLIVPTRRLLVEAGVPYVLENVMGAADLFEAPLMLCGSMFELGTGKHQLQRHRLFETSFPCPAPFACAHQGPVIGVYGGHVRQRGAKTGGRRTTDFDGEDKPRLAAKAMGIDWMTMEEISQAIPPAYTAWIGRELRAHLELRRAA